MEILRTLKTLWKREDRDARLAIDLPPQPSADQIVLVTQIRALDERLQKRRLWAHREIRVLLAGAADTAIRGADVARAREMFAEAQAFFGQALQATNRNYYLGWMIMGVLIVATIGGVLFWAADRRFGNLAAPETIVSLFAFAGMGSVTSVLTRLTSLDLKSELSKKFVIYLAVAKPLVAISFASVVYVILKNDIVTIGQWQGHAREALYWVAAFLCGFSERFASDLLGRVARVDTA